MSDFKKLTDTGSGGKPAYLATLIDLTRTSSEVIHQEFIKYSFYLPVDVLKDARWDVEPISVISGQEFWKHYQLLLEHGVAANKLQITLDPCSIDILQAAKFVGISIRHDKLSSMTYLVAKLWYGAPPKQ